jgi:hypothetical protein
VSINPTRGNTGTTVAVIISATVVLVVLIGALTILSVEHHNVDLKAAFGYILGAVGFLTNIGLLGKVRQQASTNAVKADKVAEKTENLTSIVTNGGLSANIESVVRRVVPEVIKSLGPLPATFDWIDEQVNKVETPPVSLRRDPPAKTASFKVGG